MVTAGAANSALSGPPATATRWNMQHPPTRVSKLPTLSSTQLLSPDVLELSCLAQSLLSVINVTTGVAGLLLNVEIDLSPFAVHSQKAVATLQPFSQGLVNWLCRQRGLMCHDRRMLRSFVLKISLYQQLFPDKVCIWLFLWVCYLWWVLARAGN